MQCCTVLGAVLLFMASTRAVFGPIYLLVLLYAIAYMPTVSLTNSLAFRQMTDPKMQFGPIRMLGTFGWIVAGLLIGSLKLEATAMPMRLAAAASLLMAIYCLTLPDTPPLGASKNFGIRRYFPIGGVEPLPRAFVCDLCAGFVPDLHPAAVLLCVH